MFAFDEFGDIVKKIGQGGPFFCDHYAWYACALISELSYYHITAFELEDQHRVKLVPCEQYIDMFNNGHATRILQNFNIGEAHIEKSFVIEGDRIIAVAVPIDDKIFIGFRGTKPTFVSDWAINLRLNLVRPPYFCNACSTPKCPQTDPRHLVSGYGSVHKGYIEEAARTFKYICEYMNDTHKSVFENAKEIYLAGHSLGGAVAALTAPYFSDRRVRVCTFGAPRYCTETWYNNIDEVHIRKASDIVPKIFPQFLGYQNRGWQYDPLSGTQKLFRAASNRLQVSRRCRRVASDLATSALFCLKLFAPHSIEGYRKSLGERVKARHSGERFLCTDDLQKYGIKKI